MPSNRVASLLVSAGAVLWLLVLLAPRHFDKAFWYDEVWVLQLSRQPSLSASIARTLERGSPIPVGYLAGTHLLARAADGHPWVWRVPSMIAAVILAAGIGLIVFRATQSPLASVLGVLLPFAAPHAFQRYAFEVKPYMAEAAMTVLFAALVPALVRTRARAVWAWFLPALVAAACLFSSAFAAAASWLVAATYFLRGRDWPALRRLVLWGAIVGVAWLAVFVLYTGSLSSGARLRTFWHDGYLVTDWTLPAQLWTALHGWTAACWAAYPSVPRGLIMLVLMAGMVTWIATEPLSGAAAVLTLAITLAVSAAGQWPLDIRLNMPSLALLHVGPAILAWRIWRLAADHVGVAIPERITANVVVAAVAALVLPFPIAAEARQVPADAQDVMAALKYTAAHAAPIDVLLLDQLAGTNVDAGVIELRGRRVDGPRLWKSPDAVMDAALRAPAGERAWVPVTHALDHLSGLDGRDLGGGRVFRKAWSGRGTAVFVAEPAPTASVR